MSASACSATVKLRISGTVANELATATGCSPAVYVYAGSNYLAGDEGSATAPLTSALVALDEVSGTYRYTAAFLPPGDYTVAYTCDAALDNPERSFRKLWLTPATSKTIVIPQGLQVQIGDDHDLGRMCPPDAPHQGFVLEVEPLDSLMALVRMPCSITH